MLFRSCGTRDLSLRCAGFSLVVARALECASSVVAARGLCSCGMWAPERVGSVVAACGLRCPAACGILVPRPGIEPTSPVLEGGFLTTGPPGKSQHLISYKVPEQLKKKNHFCLLNTALGKPRNQKFEVRII